MVRRKNEFSTGWMKRFRKDDLKMGLARQLDYMGLTKTPTGLIYLIDSLEQAGFHSPLFTHKRQEPIPKECANAFKRIDMKRIRTLKVSLSS